jgi:hypothetical protein
MRLKGQEGEMVRLYQPSTRKAVRKFLCLSLDMQKEQAGDLLVANPNHSVEDDSDGSEALTS